MKVEMQPPRYTIFRATRWKSGQLAHLWAGKRTGRFGNKIDGSCRWFVGSPQRRTELLQILTLYRRIYCSSDLIAVGHRHRLPSNASTKKDMGTTRERR